MSANRRNRITHMGLHHLNPPSLDSKLTSKRKAWEEHKSAPRDKGMRTEAQVPSHNGLYFLCSQFSHMPSMYHRVPYIAFQRGNERLNPSDLKE